MVDTMLLFKRESKQIGQSPIPVLGFSVWILFKSSQIDVSTSNLLLLFDTLLFKLKDSLVRLKDSIALFAELF